MAEETQPQNGVPADEGKKPLNAETHTTQPLKSLRTFQGDTEEVISRTKASLTTISIAEQKRNYRENRIVEEVGSEIKNKFFVYAGAILLSLGVLIILGVYLFRPQNQEISTTRNATPIQYDKEVDLHVENTTRNDLVPALTAAIHSFSAPVNSVLYINTQDASTSPANTQDVLNLIGPHMPNALSRSFDPTYMIGVYSFDVNAPFIVLTTSDYGASFSGMLKWEDYMIQDIGAIFGVPNQTRYTFTDESVQNKDLRIVKDDNGNTILLYSFIDKNTLLITKNEDVFNAIVSKYVTSKLVR